MIYYITNSKVIIPSELEMIRIDLKRGNLESLTVRSDDIHFHEVDTASTDAGDVNRNAHVLAVQTLLNRYRRR